MFRNLLLLISLAALTQASGLVLVEGDSDAYTDGWRDQLDPVYCSSDYTIGISIEEDITASQRVSVLDADFSDLDHYRLVFLSGDHGMEYAVLLGEILMDRDDVLLVRNREGFPEAFAVPGVHFVQPLRHIDPPREIVVPSTDSGTDDYISDIVDAVDQLSIQFYTQSLQDYGTRYSNTDNFDTACNWVQTQFESFGLTTFQQTFPMSSYSCQNVIAEKPGLVDATKIYIICGHLDSTSPQTQTNAPGADDNASGSAAVLEAARIFTDYDFNYTIRFICFGGEEQGLWGSDYYAGQAAAASEDIIGVMNLDMIYYGPTGHEVLWVPYNTQSHPLALAMEAISDTYVPELTVDIEYSPGTTYSDHSSFWNEGYAALLGIEEEVFSNPYYHQTSDILANYMMYFPFGTNCTKAALATVAYLAVPIGPTVIESGSSGIGPSGPMNLTVNPNPVLGSASLYLDREMPAGAAITIFDITGRRVADFDITSPVSAGSALVIEMEGLPHGTYMVRASDGYGHEATTMLVRL